MHVKNEDIPTQVLGNAPQFKTISASHSWYYDEGEKLNQVEKFDKGRLLRGDYRAKL